MDRWDEAVSRGVYDQVRWERDIAIKQLEEHGISFGCTAPDVVKVVRCKDCKNFTPKGMTYTWCDWWGVDPDEEDFCSHGERKDNVH